MAPRYAPKRGKLNQRVPPMPLTLRRSLFVSVALVALVALGTVLSHAVPRWFPQINLYFA
jgi:hypothetical protein